MWTIEWEIFKSFRWLATKTNEHIIQKFRREVANARRQQHLEEKKARKLALITAKDTHENKSAITKRYELIEQLLLQITKSAIHLWFVWKHLLRYRQELLKEFLDSGEAYRSGTEETEEAKKPDVIRATLVWKWPENDGFKNWRWRNKHKPAVVDDDTEMKQIVKVDEIKNDEIDILRI
ncbi:hypothetical protein RFI_05672 [Reticulomyxa filosa]|uniref:Uncharacterized protein n=1 Tax=Reticulomyxa filosa TaxID=46433 RepID=X6P049_RETFI|nr:hypothetical protein RFI_05672 [Reticulomyxa filosa]|eukprot:ETO31449.1 hypothetical protein RFI_05672 [Reticulomyxa filosa]